MVIFLKNVSIRRVNFAVTIQTIDIRPSYTINLKSIVSFWFFLPPISSFV